MSRVEAVLEQLEPWFDERERAALEAACALAADGGAIDLPALLHAVETARAPAEARRIAASALRYRLGLPVVPGAPCRKGP
ncbi:hypothetical protein ED208_08130 [Stagnimonas aquatica]|uniref:Uncharacterized protein n=1 Tax=Stagnimonas aquatica TaxID=2689987 RepID=A0A3N0VDZ1_9GAMM|nr:hypothetical protein [Stagnimonas aquatica]ROH90936.1 hypothetical protein ED208_08130 [Stagnimonas aquatica]